MEILTLDDLQDFVAPLLAHADGLLEGHHLVGLVLTRANSRVAPQVPEDHMLSGLRIFRPLDPRLAGLTVVSPDGENGIALATGAQWAQLSERPTLSLASSESAVA